MTDNQPVPYIPPVVPPVNPPGDEWYTLRELNPEREEAGGLPIGALFAALARRWVMASMVGLLLAAVAAPTVWFLTPVKYTVFTLLRVASSEPRVLPSDKGVPDAIDLFRQTQVALVVSRPVVQQALRQEKVRGLGVVKQEEDAAAWLEKKLQAGFVEGTEILRIAMVGEEEADLAEIIRAVEFTYLEEALKAEQTQRLLRLDEIQKITNASEEKIRTQREKLRRLAESLKTTDTQSLTLRQRLKLEEYAALQKELASLLSSIRVARLEIATLQGKIKALPTATWSEAEVNDFLEESDHVVKIAAEEVRLQELRLRDTRKLGTEKTVKPAEEKLKDLEKSLERLRAERRKWAVELLRRQSLTKARKDLALANDKVHHLYGLEKELKAEADAKGKEADAIGITSIELDMKRSELEQAEAVVRSLRAEKERLEVEVQSTNRRVTRLSVTPTAPEGEVYKVKNTRGRAAMAGLGGVAAFLLGSMIVGLVEFSRRRVYSGHEVVRELGLKLLGTLPRVPLALGRPPMAGQAGEATARRIGPTQNLWAERVAGLRTALLLGGKEGLPPVLMITSAGAQEGKTTLASHLAVSMASTGRKTLLLDCDLRRPVLHQIFDTTKTPGLSEVLRGEADPVDVIRPTRVSGLFLLPAGEVDREALRALAHDQVSDLFRWLKENYSCIIIDTSPVMPVADALLIGQHADGILLAVRPKVSKLPRVKEACERLKTLKRRFVGAVLNGGYEHMDADDYKYLNRYLGQS